MGVDRTRVVALLLAAQLITVGCAREESKPAQAEAAAERILASTHPGWKAVHCDECHGFPVEDHSATQIEQCAQCHGGNGACDVSTASVPHDLSSDCTSCHALQHELSSREVCRYCHLADQGLDDSCGH